MFYVAGRKVVGVLVELQRIGEKIKALTPGIGVNVNVSQDRLDHALR
jgi:biotin-(acetyl-CoA carboxylase) ligase